MLPIYKDESFMSLCRPLLDQQSSLEYTMKCQCETPMAKNCTNIFQKIKNKKKVISTCNCYRLFHSWYSYRKALSFKTRIILGTLDQGQIALTH